MTFHLRGYFVWTSDEELDELFVLKNVYMIQ